MSKKGNAAPIVLDCTLRDGGYYNNWDFSDEIVSRFLRAAGRSGVDYLELGFRMLKPGGYFGPFAYTTDTFLKTLDIPEKCAIGVMVNASDLTSYPDGAKAAIDKLFVPRENSPVELVRIAAHVDNISDCESGVGRLKELGYSVGFNVMQVSGKSLEAIGDVAATIEKWQTVDVLYFADSLGNMSADDVLNVARSLQSHWSGAIGFHAHNNMGGALANTLAAYSYGVDWLDSTVLGMGRGAGNSKIEYLLLELEAMGYQQFHADSYFDIVSGDFAKLQDKYKWGDNLYYYLSARENVHPTYVQEMLSDKRYSESVDDIVCTIRALGEGEGYSYAGDGLDVASSSPFVDVEGEWSARGWAQGRTILLIAAGTHADQYANAIESFIKKTEPLVLSLNYVDYISPQLVDAYIVSHPTRTASLADLFEKLKRPIIAPMSALPVKVRRKFKNCVIMDYGMCVTPGAMTFFDTGCIISTPMVLPYALCIAAAGGCERILLAGFEGYEPDDKRNQSVNEVFHQFNILKKGLPVISVTPTTYTVDQQSIHMPDL